MRNSSEEQRFTWKTQSFSLEERHTDIITKQSDRSTTKKVQLLLYPFNTKVLGKGQGVFTCYRRLKFSCRADVMQAPHLISFMLLATPPILSGAFLTIASVLLKFLPTRPYPLLHSVPYLLCSVLLYASRKYYLHHPNWKLLYVNSISWAACIIVYI